MNKNKFILYFFIILFFTSCAKETSEISLVKEISQSQELISAYTEGLDAFNSGDYYYSASKFLESEILFPQSQWASKSVIMASYAYYMQNYYSLAIDNLKRYFELYPKDKNQDYARYLLALCYFELIVDQKRDTAAILLSKNEFQIIVNKFPNSEYAIDAKLKLDLLDNLLAAKEVYLGRYYIKKNKWISALNRFKKVLDEYERTDYIEEAIHRMVEINYNLGLMEESKKYANLLGYNYQSSEWYKETYRIFNKDYLILDKEIQKDKKGILKKMKNLFE